MHCFVAGLGYFMEQKEVVNQALQMEKSLAPASSCQWNHIWAPELGWLSVSKLPQLVSPHQGWEPQRPLVNLPMPGPFPWHSWTAPGREGNFPEENLDTVTKRRAQELPGPVGGVLGASVCCREAVTLEATRDLQPPHRATPSAVSLCTHAYSWFFKKTFLLIGCFY